LVARASRPEGSARLLTEVEAVDRVALGCEGKAVALLVDLKVADATPEAAAHWESLEAAAVARAADEQRLPEGDPREEAL
jgi:hypothetical protein